MKLKLPFILLVVLIGLGTNSIKATPLILELDTLFLKPEKHKGYGLFEIGHWSPRLQEVSDNDGLLKVIPSSISNPKLAQDFIDMKIFAYENIKKNNPEYLDTFINENYPERIDTANIPSELDNSLQFIVGMKGMDRIYIIDENNNKDFRDDSIRMLNKMNFYAPTPEPVKCHYRIYNGKEMVNDSSWILIELDKSNKIKISVAHHLKSTFTLNNQEYEIQIVNWIPYVRFCFDSPIISITSQNGVKKDSLLKSEIFEIGEYLKFGDSYYKFENITNDGSIITLIKEEVVSDKIGTQVGFIAPDFDCVTTEGDSISLTDYKNEPLLLVNVTACWSPIMSYEYFKELSEEYKSKVDIIAIDESPGILDVNIKDFGLSGRFVIASKHRAVKNNYREDFCSRTCFLISPHGYIIDKFPISDWKIALEKHFK